MKGTQYMMYVDGSIWTEIIWKAKDTSVHVNHSFAWDKLPHLKELNEDIMIILHNTKIICMTTLLLFNSYIPRCQGRYS